LTFKFEHSLGFENPFDLETNRVELTVQLPDFSARTLSFFYDGVNEQGVERWEARYTPPLAGEYHFTIRIPAEKPRRLVVPVASNGEPRKGGLKISRHLGAFAYETGEVFRGIGLNICWARDYEPYFRKMQAAGMNITRIWMCPWHLPLEWKHTGLGRYDLDAARRLEHILDLADTYGIFVILCMDFHGVAPKGMGYFRENRWLENPYNVANGGPCRTAADLFTDDAATVASKKRYKYIVSRFGHCSRIAAWEFFNEADLMAGRSVPVNRWHILMAEYVRSIDVHHRLVSTSSTRNFPERVVDAFRSPAMDFVMYHQYNTPDMAPYIVDLHEATTEYYHKPVVLGEFGIEYRGADRTIHLDPEHAGLHNGIWAGWFSETPIIPLSWWWDNYIDTLDLWREYARLSQFASLLSLDQSSLAFASLSPGAGDSASSAECLVRMLVCGPHRALWIKNDMYQWSRLSEGEAPREISRLQQRIHGLLPGSYTVTWYDPQTGNFLGKAEKKHAGEDGAIVLPVPRFSRDVACVVKQER
jgi:hypothetical protein